MNRETVISCRNCHCLLCREQDILRENSAFYMAHEDNMPFYVIHFASNTVHCIHCNSPLGNLTSGIISMRKIKTNKVTLNMNTVIMINGLRFAPNNN